MILDQYQDSKQAPLLLILGPCVIESEDFIMDVAGAIKEISSDFPINLIFKSSYDKANRTSIDSFRGLGIEKGLEILEKVKSTYDVPILTDIHTPAEAALAGQSVDVIQTPAFLCRQTDLIQAAVKTGKHVNIKKGQFLSPSEMKHVVDKAFAAGGEGRVMVCERGSCFGYNNLVVDMRSLAIMRETQCPVIFDATHSVQEPGALSASSGGRREFVPYLARAAVAVGVAGVFAEVHPNPEKALSDGANALPLSQLEPFIDQLVNIKQAFNNSARTQFD